MLEANDHSNADDLAVRIADDLAGPSDIDGVTFAVKSSIGIAVYPENGRSAQELLKSADRAMYVAKQLKKGAGPHGLI